LRYFRLFTSTIGAIIFFVASWAIISSNVNLDLNKADHLTGKVTSVEIATTVTGKYRIHQKTFRFSLDNYDYLFDAYRPSQEYSTLLNNIKVEDLVTVYFYKWKDDNTAMDIYQIKKMERLF